MKGTKCGENAFTEIRMRPRIEKEKAIESRWTLGRVRELGGFQTKARTGMGDADRGKKEGLRVRRRSVQASEL